MRTVRKWNNEADSNTSDQDSSFYPNSEVFRFLGLSVGNLASMPMNTLTRTIPPPQLIYIGGKYVKRLQELNISG